MAFTKKQRKYDAGRDRWLFEAYGVKTVRVENKDVLKGQGALSSLLLAFAKQECFSAVAH